MSERRLNANLLFFSETQLDERAPFVWNTRMVCPMGVIRAPLKTGIMDPPVHPLPHAVSPDFAPVGPLERGVDP